MQSKFPLKTEEENFLTLEFTRINTAQSTLIKVEECDASDEDLSETGSPLLTLLNSSMTLKGDTSRSSKTIQIRERRQPTRTFRNIQKLEVTDKGEVNAFCFTFGDA